MDSAVDNWYYDVLTEGDPRALQIGEVMGHMVEEVYRKAPLLHEKATP